MIRKYEILIEAHTGYTPRFIFRRAPTAGDVLPEGLLIPCEECSGSGFLAIDLKEQNGTIPTPEEGS